MIGGFRISSWAIRNPVPVAILFIALVASGIGAYTILPVKLQPDVTFPVVEVTVTENGAAPSEMETQITRPLENAFASIPNIEEMQSTVTRGASVTDIQFELGTDMQKATDDVRTKEEQTRASLPRDIDPPTVVRDDEDADPILYYAVSADNMSPVQLSWFVDDTVSRALQGEPGVSTAGRFGGRDREINVIVNPDALIARGITMTQLNSALASFSIDESGGQVEIGGRRQTLRVLGTPRTVDQLRNTEIPTSGGAYVRLSDVAEVGDGSSEVQQFARLDGREVVALYVTKTRTASDVAVENNVNAGITKLEKQYPGLHFTKIVSTVDQTRANFEATQHTLLEGMLLASLVVFVFLREWRSTLIAAVAMPVSLIPTFLAMVLFGFSLDMISMLALTLVIGILVDDAIVEIENIQKRVDAGRRPYYAAVEGADSIGLAVVATTFTIVLVFLPVSFMPGIPGEFFKEFGVTVSVAVLFSLLTARLLTPLLAAYFLRPSPNPHTPGPLKGPYRIALDWALSHRILSIIGGGLLFAGSLWLATILPTGVQPPGNPDYYRVRIEGQPGATPAQMDSVVRRLTAMLKTRPETAHVFANVGSSGANGAGMSQGSIVVVLKPHRSLTVTQLKGVVGPMFLNIPDARVSFNSGGFGQGGVQITLASESGQGLDYAALELQREMNGLRTVASPRPGNPAIGPELVIRPKPDEAARLGVNVDTIATVARIATLGDIDANVSKFNAGDQRVPIRVRLPEDARKNMDVVKNIQVPTANGSTTPLSSIADITFQAGPAEIDRYNRMRQLTVNGDLAHGAQLGEALKEVRSLPIMKHLPPGVHEQTTGESKIIVQLFEGLGVAIVAGIFLIYGVMVLLFRSFFKPVVILSALPLATGGAFLALLLGGTGLNLPSLIGFLMLLGLAAKNSILLVEYAIEEERAGATQREALIEACRQRARPIIMTTLAMQAGMLPTALGIGSGSEFRQPMAIAVIGGLITSTALSLVLVPVVYEVIDDIERWLAPRFSRLVTPKDAPEPPSPQPLAAPVRPAPVRPEPQPAE